MSQKQISYNEMRLGIFWVAHTKLRYRLIIQPTTPVPWITLLQYLQESASTEPPAWLFLK